MLDPASAPLAAPVPMSSAASDASRGSAIRMGAEMAGRLLSLATTVFLAAKLGVAGFGSFAAFSGASAILAEIANAGLLTTASRELVTGAFSLRAMVQAKLMVSVLVTAFAGMLYGAWPLLTPLVLYFVWAGWAEFLGVALRSWGRPFQEALLLLVLRAGGLALVASALSVGVGADPTEQKMTRAAWAFFVSSLPALALGVVLVRTQRPRTGPAAADEAVVPMRVLRASLPLAVNGVLAMASMRVELLALFLLRGPQETGLFAAALRLVEPLLAVPVSLSAGAMPALTRESQRGEGPARRRTAATVAFLAAPAAVGLAIVGPQLLPLVGSAFRAASGPLRVLAGALLALFMNACLLHALVAAGRSAFLPRLTALRLAIALVLALVLVPLWGASGGAVGFLCAELGLLVLASRACTSAHFPVPVVEPLGLAVAASLPMGVVLLFLPHGGGPLGSIALGAVTYVLTLLVAWRCWPASGPLARVFKA